MLYLFISSCNNDDIYLSNQQAVQASFYTVRESGEVKDTVVYSLFAYGLENDKILDNDTVDASSLFLPLDLNSNQTQWVLNTIKSTGTFSATITFEYEKELDFVSGNSGMTQNIILKKVSHTGSFIDSVVISYPNINYDENQENVKIYIPN